MMSPVASSTKRANTTIALYVPVVELWAHRGQPDTHNSRHNTNGGGTKDRPICCKSADEIKGGAVGGGQTETTGSPVGIGQAQQAATGVVIAVEDAVERGTLRIDRIQ